MQPTAQPTLQPAGGTSSTHSSTAAGAAATLNAVTVASPGYSGASGLSGLPAPTTSSTFSSAPNLFVTTTNRLRAEALAKIIEKGELLKVTRIGKEEITYPNPTFTAILHMGNVPAERLANVRALLDRIENDPALRGHAEAQGIDPSEWEEMLQDAASAVEDDIQDDITAEAVLSSDGSEWKE